MYCDALHQFNDVLVSERRQDGSRRIVKMKAPYFFYVEDPAGPFTTMFGAKCRKETFKTRREMREAKDGYSLAGVPLFESDVRTEYKALESAYAGVQAPNLHVAIVDIEVDSDPSVGWARYSNPYAPINALTAHLAWTGDTVTLLVPPPGMSVEKASELVAGMEQTYVMASEAELLEAFLELCEDADVTTGWNSEKFDMPYIVARVRVALGGENASDFVTLEPRDDRPPEPSAAHLKKMCLFGEVPRKGSVEEYGSVETVYAFPGRPHLDYLRLYRKMVLEPRESYKLDNILKVEVNQKKVSYEGTLYQLYRDDLKLFAEYNRQDVLGLAAVDKKLGLIEIANEMAHKSCVFLTDALGSVSKIEQAILLKLHSLGMVAPDKVEPDRHGKIPGAFVFEPRAGLYDWVCNYDVKSLYPSVIRLLNISPETVVGQFKLTKTEAMVKDLGHEDAWKQLTGAVEYHLIMDADPFERLTLVLESGEEVTQTGQEWNDFFASGGLALSASGTVFSLEKEGIVSLCLTEWFDERKKFQRLAKDFKVKASGLSGAELASVEEEHDRWDRKQGVSKVFLNSTYGALLNDHFRFGGRRLGMSVTLSGRVIIKHLAKQTNKELSGDYDFGASIIYGDTDSVSGSSVVKTSIGDISIEELFNACAERGELAIAGDVQHARCDDVEIAALDDCGRIELSPFHSVYRHRVSKPKWVVSAGGREVEMTADHGMIVARRGELIEVRPPDVSDGDEAIYITP